MLTVVCSKWYSWVIVSSAALQLACYIFRDLSIKFYDNSTWYTLYFILMMVGLQTAVHGNEVILTNIVSV